jgi:polyisoprenoid-binding protein YceI
MTKLLFSLFMFVSLALTAQAGTRNNGDNVKVSPTASKVEWIGRKVTGKHNGTINIKDGHIQVKDGFLTGGSVTIDMTSIRNLDMTGEYATKLENHLKSDDFFSAATHPTAILVITQANAKGNGQYDVKANLTIKGATHPISFNTQLIPDGKKYKAVANITIDRSLYNVKYGSGKFFEGLGDKTIYDEFDLTITLVTE